jgi:predicted neutral ceramidase superfamily lipid hydrolase
VENTVDEISRFYAKLFRLGSLERNIIIYALMLSITTILFWALNPHYISISPLLAITYIAEYMIYRYYLTFSYKLLNLRRLLGANSIALGFSCILLIIGIAFKGIVPTDTTLYFYFGVFIGFKTIVFLTLTFEGMIKSIYPVLADIALVTLSSWVTGIFKFSGLAIQIIYAGASMLYIYLINRITLRYSGRGAITYLRSYVSSWSEDDPGPMEALMDTFSIKKDVEIEEYIFEGQDKFRIVIPYFHFGPFRNVGSSAFPSELKRALYMLRAEESMVVHTPVSHDLDLSSSSYMYRIIDELITHEGGHSLNKISSMYKQEFNDAVAYGFRMGDNAIIILSYREMEDIPYEVVHKLRDYGVKKGFRSVSVIDAHNSLVSLITFIDDEKLDEIYTAGESLIDKLSDVELYDLKASLSSLSFPEFALDDGLGKGGVSIFFWRAGTMENLIVCFDSNNLDPKFRSALERAIKEELGIENMVVISTDTHEVTARGVENRGYVVWGSKANNFKVIPKIVNEIKRLRNNLNGYRALYKVVRVNVKVLGEDIIDKTRSLIRVSFRYSKILAITLYSIATLASILLMI